MPGKNVTFHHPFFDPDSATENNHIVRQVEGDSSKEKFRHVVSSSKSKSELIFARPGFPANVDGTHIFAVQIDKSKVCEDTRFGFASGPRKPLANTSRPCPPQSVGTLLCPYDGLRTISAYWRELTESEMEDSGGLCLELDDDYEHTPAYTEDYFELEKDEWSFGKKHKMINVHYCHHVTFLICILTISENGKSIEVQWIQDGKEGPVVDCTVDFEDDEDDEEEEESESDDENEKPVKMIYPTIALPISGGYGATFVTPDKLCHQCEWMSMVFSETDVQREKLKKKVKKLKKKVKKLKEKLKKLKQKSGKRRQRDEETDEEEFADEEEEEEEEEERKHQRELDHILEKIDAEIAEEAK